MIALAKNPFKNADTNRLILQLLRVRVLPGQKSNPLLQVVGGHVIIDATSTAMENTQALLAELQGLGLLWNGVAVIMVVSGYLPIGNISDMEDLVNLHSVRPAYR